MEQRVSDERLSDWTCGHPSIGHNDGYCCAVCELGAEIVRLREALVGLVEWQNEHGSGIDAFADCRSEMVAARAVLRRPASPEHEEIAALRPQPAEKAPERENDLRQIIR